ncbi:MAG: alpha-2-macroglobulin family protein [Acidimicrobiales bacterium]|nr:alpha-2-macroglobulin family protein [Acidimicrobiales bacterium]
MRPNRRRRWLLVAMVVGLLAGACTVGDGDEDAEEPEAGVADEATGPFELRLSSGEVSAAEEELAVATGDELSEDDVASVTDRLPELPGGDDDRVDFRRPAETLPPPRVGRTLEEPFGVAGDDSPPEVDDGPLEVLRHQPDGAVGLAPFVSVTFNQPMVPVGTVDALGEEEVPVEVSPDIDGRWRWLGTRTLRFENTSETIDRLPAATEYTVTVPAGAESATGDALAEESSFTFSTPAPSVESVTPGGDVIDADPVFVVTFDQRVEPEAVLEHLSLTAGDDTVETQPASDEEVDADDDARAAVEQALPGRSVAFRPSAPLPGDTAVAVEVGAGTPSAEGPRTTAEPQRHETRTRAALDLVGTECGFMGCRPGAALSIVFNNPLDPEAFDSDQVTVEPDIGASISPQGDRIVLQGATQANTTYDVTISADLQDGFGQTLGRDETVTFEIGEATPAIRQFPRPVITTDPFLDDPVLPIVSAGHETLDVTIHDVGPEDIQAYADYLRSRRHEDLRDLPDWPVMAETTVQVDEPAELNESLLDLGSAIGGGGHVVVTVASTRDLDQDSEAYWESRPAVAWIQSTSIGLDALADHGRLLAWATDLEAGAPIEGAEVQLGGTGPRGTTDGQGLADLELGAGDYLLARSGGDSAVLIPENGDRWESYDPGHRLRWHTFDGRGLFRPGDELAVKGWVRRLDIRAGASLEQVEADRTVRYTVRDAVGNEVATGDAELTDQGGFEVRAELPDGAALGEARVEVRLEGGDVGGVHTFQIQEFRRPEFEVVTEAASAEPHVMTGPVQVSAEASYFAGGVLPDAPVTWQVTTRNTTYSPPNWPGFTFGVAPPPWFETAGGSGTGLRGTPMMEPGFTEECCPGRGPEAETEAFTYEARADTSGRHVLRVDFSGQKPDEPVFVSANASVEDVNRQAFASTSELLVHPASLYVGLRGERNFVQQGEPLGVEAVVTDIDGNVVEGREVTITADRIVEEFRGGEVVETEVDTQECVVGSEDDPVDCEFDTPTGGRYRITAVVNDDEGGSSRTELTRWVAGADAVPSRTVDGGVARIVPSSTDLTAGDTAELLVASPFADGHGLLTVTRAGIEQTRTFEVSDGSAVLDLDITDAMVPGVDLRVDLVGQAPRAGDDGSSDDGLPPRPAYADGQIHLDVRADSRTLDVSTTPGEDRLEPGGSTNVEVAVESPDGAAVEGAEVAVAVVDEALLSLVDYEVGDPIESFYTEASRLLRSSRSRRGILLAPPSHLGGASPAAPSTTLAALEEMDPLAQGADGATEDAAAGAVGAPTSSNDSRTAAGTDAPAIDSRADFSAVATFEPAVTTGGDGTATVEVDLPDNLTRYRVMAVAAHGDRFGTGESTITAQLPLQVRPSPPRFTNFGDTFEFPVVVQNTTGEAVTADVVLETTNLSVDGSHGRRVEVPANERVEVRFPVETEDAGTARYRATVVSGDSTDSATGELPAYTPTTTEAFATYGVVDEGGVAQPLQTPEGVVDQFGGLEIDTASTSLQALTDAVVYLADYEYRSADAYASRITALVSLRDVFAAFEAPDQPTPDELDDTIRSDLERLATLQNDDGGFPSWQRGRPSSPFLTVQAAHALVVAGAEGYPVAGDVKGRAMEYLRTIDDRFPADWPEEARLAAQAYAVHVRDLDGDRDPGRAASLYRSTPAPPLDVLAWLWPVVDDPATADEIGRTFANRVTETPSAATFTTGYEESARALVLASDRRTDGIALDALITQQPDSDLIPKVVTGLLGNQRRDGHWSNVQENGFILLAMKRYFDTFEATTPDFVARAWLGDDYMAEHAHRGRSIDTVRTTVPLTELGEDPDIVVQRDGAGRLYYRLGLRYAPDDLALDPRDEGFVVDRTYEAVDDPDDVVRNDDGSWAIEPGAMVRVKLSMVADSARTNMALVDHLPAGLEALNPALAATPRPPAEEEAPGDGIEPPTWFGFTWFDHQSFRDDRSEAFSSYLPAGTYEYTYEARATTPGTFVTPPAKAEEIYAPEVFGRSGTDTVTVG